MKIKAIFSDLDGVLIALKDSHYVSLNNALKEVVDYEIPYEEHLKYYDGKTTNTKLKILENRGIVEERDKKSIWELKQKYTVDYIYTFPLDNVKIETFKKLKEEGYILACVSNSIRDTVIKVLEVIGISEYMDFIMPNEDMIEPKPSKYPYTQAMEKAGVLPEESLILEDNFNGLQSAEKSGGWIFEVKEVEDVNYENIKKRIEEIENCK